MQNVVIISFCNLGTLSHLNLHKDPKKVQKAESLECQGPTVSSVTA